MFRLLARQLLPGECPVCGAPGEAPCPACWRRLAPAPPGPPPAGVDRCLSLLRYDDAGRELLARFKYRNARSPLPWLVEGMSGLVRGAGPFDAVTWAPTSGERRRDRGFDQAELLARAVGRRIRTPSRRLLARLPGPAQTGRGAADRLVGPRFLALSGPGSVLVVDDVLTTGATMAAAAAALRRAGSASVVAVTAGRTPLKIHQPTADA